MPEMCAKSQGRCQECELENFRLVMGPVGGNGVLLLSVFDEAIGKPHNDVGAVVQVAGRLVHRLATRRTLC